MDASIAHLRAEIPSLEKQIKEQEAKIPGLSEKAEKVTSFYAHCWCPHRSLLARLRRNSKG
jgi:hypothetical protein